MREIGRRECQFEPIAKLQIVKSVAYPAPDGLHSRKAQADCSGEIWPLAQFAYGSENFSVLPLCGESAKLLRCSSSKQLEKVGQVDEFQLRDEKV